MDIVNMDLNQDAESENKSRYRWRSMAGMSIDIRFSMIILYELYFDFQVILIC